MNVQNSSEVRELTTTELEAVAGGSLKNDIGMAVHLVVFGAIYHGLCGVFLDDPGVLKGLRDH